MLLFLGLSANNYLSAFFHCSIESEEIFPPLNFMAYRHIHPDTIHPRSSSNTPHFDCCCCCYHRRVFGPRRRHRRRRRLGRCCQLLRQRRSSDSIGLPKGIRRLRRLRRSVEDAAAAAAGCRMIAQAEKKKNVIAAVQIVTGNPFDNEMNSL